MPAILLVIPATVVFIVLGGYLSGVMLSEICFFSRIAAIQEGG
jgi:hypothetical protein